MASQSFASDDEEPAPSITTPPPSPHVPQAPNPPQASSPPAPQAPNPPEAPCPPSPGAPQAPCLPEAPCPPSPGAPQAPNPPQALSPGNESNGGVDRVPSSGDKHVTQPHSEEEGRPATPQETPTRRIRPSPAETLPLLYGSGAHTLRLKHYQDEHSDYDSQLVSQEDACRTRRNDMYQLLAMFALVQGVVFSAVAQSTILNCHHSSLPISLSCTTSLATIVALVRELISIGQLQEEIERTRNRAGVAYGMIEQIKLEGVDFDLTRELERPDGQVSEKQPWRHVCSVYGMSLLAFLVLVSVGIVVSSAMVLCRECRCK